MVRLSMRRNSELRRDWPLVENPQLVMVNCLYFDRMVIIEFIADVLITSHF